MRIVLICLVAVMVSCSPQKKLNRLLKKHPELIVKDTVNIKDTIITESVKHDTLLNWNTLYDTAYIEKDKLRIKVVRVNDSIFIRGECVGDTIYYEKQVLVDKIIQQKSEQNKWFNKLLFVLMLIFVILFLLRK
jgi:hypothetical protein